MTSEVDDFEDPPNQLDYSCYNCEAPPGQHCASRYPDVRARGHSERRHLAEADVRRLEAGKPRRGDPHDSRPAPPDLAEFMASAQASRDRRTALRRAARRRDAGLI